jgi:hypothetical protein
MSCTPSNRIWDRFYFIRNEDSFALSRRLNAKSAPQRSEHAYFLLESRTSVSLNSWS